MVGRQHYIYKGLEDEDDKEVLSSFIKQYYMGKSILPNKIMVKEEIEDKELIEMLLTSQAGRKDKEGMKMKCPYCGAQDTKVIDSRPADDNSAIRRRRQCEQCGKRFTTYEKLETLPLMIIKKDNSREAYDRSKIEKGILLSCHKRPISSEQIRNMIDEIETEIFSREEKEIPASDVGELVMRKLKDVDEVAYVRFASVYREFKDVNAFMEELAKFLNNKQEKDHA